MSRIDFAFTQLRPAAWAALAALSLGLSACGGADGYKAIELNIAHLNDHHSQLDPITAQTLKLDGVETQVELGGFARQTQVFKSLAGTPNLLKLHAGDANTGTLYYTFFDGKADAQMMNTVCFDAFVPGNHEFDDGDAKFKTFLDALADPALGGCGTQTVAANIAPAAGTALAPAGGKPYLQPFVIKKIDGVDVGIVGLSPGAKIKNSSRPLASTEFKDEVSSAQQAIDELRAQGVRHIVLLSHLGYEADKAIAPKLSDVDVIIGGDSHSLLGDFSAVGVTSSSGSYPTKVQNKSGETVCIGQAWEYAKAYGLMNVKFDDKARVQDCGGQAKLVLGDSSFKRKDSAGAWQPMAEADRQALVTKLAAVPQVKVVTPDTAAAATLKTYSDKVNDQKAIIIGQASEALCLVRMPGESTNRSGGVAGCESANSLARGSDAAQVVAEAFLNASKRADFALQNAGGVRTPIAAGDISMNTAFTVLPFTNVLVEMNLSGDQIIAALEDGVANYDNSSSTGSHPYAAGLRWDLDLSKAKGQRFSNVQLRNKTTGTWSAIDKARTYVLVTNDFVAAGGDGYATLGQIYKSGAYVNTYLLYTQSFVDYVKARGSIARPARADYSHQQVISKTGVTLSAN